MRERNRGGFTYTACAQLDHDAVSEILPTEKLVLRALLSFDGVVMHDQI